MFTYAAVLQAHKQTESSGARGVVLLRPTILPICDVATQHGVRLDIVQVVSAACFVIAKPRTEEYEMCAVPHT